MRRSMISVGDRLVTSQTSVSFINLIATPRLRHRDAGLVPGEETMDMRLDLCKRDSLLGEIVMMIVDLIEIVASVIEETFRYLAWNTEPRAEAPERAA
jgi:hypothetical protein